MYFILWYLNYFGGIWFEVIQCMFVGNNGWDLNYVVWNYGVNNYWVLNNMFYSIGYYKWDDLFVYFVLVEGWIFGDMY